MPEVERPFPPDVLAGIGPAYDDAIRALRDPAFCRSQKYQEQQMRVAMQGVHPWLLEFVPLFVARMRKLDVPVFLQEAVRSDEQQAKEIAEGDSKVRLSPHQRGCAVHLIHGVHGWTMNKKQWALLGHVGKELCRQRGFDLEWGGDWRDPWDPAHWQVRGWRMVANGFPFKIGDANGR